MGIHWLDLTGQVEEMIHQKWQKILRLSQEHLASSREVSVFTESQNVMEIKTGSLPFCAFQQDQIKRTRHRSKKCFGEGPFNDSIISIRLNDKIMIGKFIL